MARTVEPAELPSYSPRSLPKRAPALSYTSLSEYDWGYLDAPWRKEGACLDADPDLFFPDQGVPNKEGRAICESCPVQTECLTFALENGERHGIWGGLTQDERSDMAYLMLNGRTFDDARDTVKKMRRSQRKRLRLEMRVPMGVKIPTRVPKSRPA